MTLHPNHFKALRALFATATTTAIAAMCSCCFASATGDFGAERAKMASIKLESRSLASGKKIWSGTGFFVEGHSLAITNNHVATDAAARPDQTALIAIFPDGKEARATIVLADMALDLAALSIDRKPQAKLPLRMDAPRLGEKIAGAGYGLGMEFSLAEGRVAAEDSPDELWPRSQISAATDGGVSGGPTLDLEGSAVGANVAGAGRSVALSIPSNAIEPFLTRAEAAQAQGSSWEKLSGPQVMKAYQRQFTQASNLILASLSSPDISRIGPWSVASPPETGPWNCGDEAFHPDGIADPKPWMSRHDGFSCSLSSAPMSMGPNELGSDWVYTASRFEPRATSALQAWTSWMAYAIEDRLREAFAGLSCHTSSFSKNGASGYARTCAKPIRNLPGLFSGSQTVWKDEPQRKGMLMLRLDFEGLDALSMESSGRWLAAAGSYAPIAPSHASTPLGSPKTTPKVQP